MSKVILTQKQAESLELILEKANENKDLALEWISPAIIQEKRLNEKFSSLKELSVGEIARALYVGYEVEPEFKVGDWVHNNVTGRVAKIDDRGYDEEVAWVDDDKVNFFTQFRHATPEEIAEEKERRWWKKHGREVWELRSRDILKQKSGNELAEVKKVHNSGYLIGKWTCYESKEYIKKHYTVACFAENRLDVKDDE